MSETPSPEAPETPVRRVGILAFEGMEVLDYAGPYEVFNVAGEVSGGAFEVRSLALRAGNVTARGGFTVVPDAAYDSVSPPEIVVVPGGDGVRMLLDDTKLLDWVSSAASSVEILASVCTGSLVLASAGLLENRSATTHHMAFDSLSDISPTTQVITDQRFVHGGDNIWTSGGISAGVDLALALVENLAGARVRETVVEVMEWGWHPSR